MSREKEARKRHNSGYSCSSSVYSTFSDLVSGTAPFPRSEGGKCGAVLSAEKILQQLGMSSAEFDEEFIKQFGSLKCGELRKSRVPCNDLVGIAAKMVEEKLT